MSRPHPVIARRSLPGALAVLLAAALVSGLAVGCDVTTTEHLVDPDVVPWDSPAEPPDVPPGTILIELGAWEGDVFVAWPEEGGAFLEVVDASQGGTWVMPAMRVAGSAPKTIVDCTITTADGERVGRMQSSVKFFPGDPGWLDIEFLPVRIRRSAEHAGEPLEAIFGGEATLDLTVVDEDDNEGELVTTVILIKG